MSDELERELEQILRAVSIPPAGHVDRILERVERVERVRRAAVPLPAPMPWWILVLTDRAVVLALALAAALAAWGPGLYRMALPLTEQPLLRTPAIPYGSAWMEPRVLAALALAAAPLLVWLGAQTYLWCLRMAATPGAKGTLRQR